MPAFITLYTGNADGYTLGLNRSGQGTHQRLRSYHLGFKHAAGNQRMAHGDRTIIVVDDEPLIRMDLADILRAGGFKVVEGQNAAEALNLLEDAENVAALVTDVQMPGAFDGVGLTWRTYRYRPKTALVVLSGAPRPAPADLPPGTRFLAKPVDGEVLLREVNGAIGDRSSGRQD